jgi:hypothetical protein
MVLIGLGLLYNSVNRVNKWYIWRELGSMKTNRLIVVLLMILVR